MYLTHKFFLLIFSLFLLTACGRSTDPPTPTPAPTQTAAIPTATPVPVPAATPEEVTLEEENAGDTADGEADEAADTGNDATAADDAAENEVGNPEESDDATDSEAAETEEDVVVADDAAEDGAEPEGDGTTAADDVAEDEADEVVAETEPPYMGRPPEELWASLACSACHQLNEDQTDANRGPVGPHQGNLADRIAIIAPDQSPEEYVYTSIVDPDAYVVESYFPGIMPQTYGDQMSEEEIRALARWMLEPNR